MNKEAEFSNEQIKNVCRVGNSNTENYNNNKYFF